MEINKSDYMGHNKHWSKTWCCSIFKIRVHNQEIRSSTIYWSPASCIRFAIDGCMHDTFGGKTLSPNINYFLFLIKNYDDFVKNFK